MNTTRIGKRPNVVGDDLDDAYLKGTPSPNAFAYGCFLAIVVLVVTFAF